ncbi:uncharacterized protein TNCV_777531 [Trichonephila clavipes]|nr:uncharacterized protein TNCV_777531 [Trichonephila clavipes]
MEFLKNRKDFFKDLSLDTVLNEMLCDAREFADEIYIPANFELTRSRHRIRRRNVNLDYEAREDPIEDPTLKYKTEFYFFTLDKAINALESRMSEEKESIKVARGRVKGSLTRLENGADDLNLKNEILIQLQRLEELIVDLERLDSELSAEESEIMEFEQRYFDLKLKFQDKIDAIDASRSIIVSGQNISIAIPTEQFNANFRLPKLNIPVFSDEPASLIKHIPLSNESYEEAWGKLIDRYDKKKQIVYALIKTFLDQKCISLVNMTNLRNLVDTSDEVLRGLKALGTEATNRDP